MAGDVHVQEPPAPEREHKEHVEQPERDRRYDQKVEGDRARAVRSHEGAPGRRWGQARSTRRLRHVLRHGVLVDVVAQFCQLARDAPATPERVLARHAFDQRDELGVKRWTAEAS
jgi:hypothetical protein